MRVVLLSAGLPDSIGDLANSLCNSVELLLIVPENMPGDFSKEYLSPKIKFVSYFQHRRRNPQSIFSISEIAKSIENFNPEVIHIYVHNPWFSLLYPFLKKYPIVHTIHDPTEHPGEEKLRDKFVMLDCLRTAERFTVLSSKMKEKMVRLHNVPRKKIDVMPIALPLRYCKLQKRKVAEVKNSVLFFGRIWKYKGLEYLIKSEPIISKEIPNLRIVVAGRGEDMNSYIAMITDKSKFQIINRYIDDSEINELFQKSSLVVMPYIEASQSNIMLLAYHFGKPVVVTNVGGLPESVVNGETGILIPPADKEVLARAIILLLKSPYLRKRMGQKGQDLFGGRFSWDETSNKTINCYRKCLS